MTGCAVCFSSSIPCFRCQIHTLKLEVSKLKTQLAEYEDKALDELRISDSQYLFLTDPLIQDTEPLGYNYLDVLSNCYFFTLTFDPARFGLKPHVSDRERYILFHLLKAFKQKLFFSCYGSFEFHKTGIVHAHLIVHTGQPKELYQYLKPRFTNNPYNKVAVDYGKAKYPQAKQYIDKESTSYFYIDKLNANDIATPVYVKPKDDSEEENPLDYLLDNDYTKKEGGATAPTTTMAPSCLSP